MTHRPTQPDLSCQQRLLNSPVPCQPERTPDEHTREEEFERRCCGGVGQQRQIARAGHQRQDEQDTRQNERCSHSSSVASEDGHDHKGRESRNERE